MGAHRSEKWGKFSRGLYVNYGARLWRRRAAMLRNFIRDRAVLTAEARLAGTQRGNPSVDVPLLVGYAW